MAVAVGVDVAKEFHWATMVQAETGTVLASHSGLVTSRVVEPLSVADRGKPITC